jgi:hypothetical protein
MATYDWTQRFGKDWLRLTAEEQRLFHVARRQFVYDLNTGRGFRAGLRIKKVQGQSGVFEMTWADDGRATFSFGRSPHPGDTHIIWHRIGGHEILDKP